MNIEIKKIPVTHEDDRRTLTAIFNGDFIAQQVKILQAKKYAQLGGHFHNYPELFYILSGKIDYFLEKSGESSVGTLHKGERMIIPPQVKHTMHFYPNTISIEATTETYISPKENDK